MIVHFLTELVPLAVLTLTAWAAVTADREHR